MLPKQLSEEEVLSGRFRVEKGRFERNGREFERYRIDRVDAACILLWDREKDEVILTRQFRYPVAAHQQEMILEIVAGKVDDGEGPMHTAVRETEEETGYVVSEKQVTFCTSGYTSPGYTTERFHIFIAEVSSADKTSKGGGLEEEAEEIELVSIPTDEFYRQVDENEIVDIKTILAAKYLEKLRRK